MFEAKRVVITGMSINTPLGDTLEAFFAAMMRGQSAITRWKKIDTTRIYSKIGADLTDYDYTKKLNRLESIIPENVFRRVRKIVTKSPWSTKLTTLLAVDAFINANLFENKLSPSKISTVVAGHNLGMNYEFENQVQFIDEPEFIDSMYSLYSLDTDHAGSISDVLQCKGPTFTVGAACASGNAALRLAFNEIKYHDSDAALVTGPIFDYSPIYLQSLALMGAISCKSFNNEPTKASRPFDSRREGFVPAHGGGVIVLESLESALRRGAQIHAEIVGIEANADGNHLPEPSAEGQSYLMKQLFEKAGIWPEQIDYINAHASSTPLGDRTEIRSIKHVFGKHASRLKINATKSILGHVCWSAPIVETIATVLQINSGELHPSINVDELESEIDLDVCANHRIKLEVEYALKNSFGFGGLNCVSIIKRFEK